MLRAQLLFFFPLAIAASLFIWFGRCYPFHQEPRRYLLLVLGGWLGATCLLFVVMSVVTPSDGLKEVPVLLGAYAMPVAAVAIAASTVGKRLSVEGRVLLTLALSAAAGIFAPFFLLFAACAIQASCL